MKVSKRSFRQKNPVRLIPHWRKGSYGGVCLLRFSFEGFIVEDPQNPGCFLPVLPPVPVTQGNIVVHDSTP